MSVLAPCPARGRCSIHDTGYHLCLCLATATTTGVSISRITWVQHPQRPSRSFVFLNRNLLLALDYTLKAFLGLTGASKSRPNVSRPCPFPVIPEGPDLSGRAGEGLSLPAQSSLSLCLTGNSGPAPGQARLGDPGPARDPQGEAEAAVPLTKGLYRPPSSNSCRITHGPGREPIHLGPGTRSSWDFSFGGDTEFTSGNISLMSSP